MVPTLHWEEVPVVPVERFSTRTHDGHPHAWGHYHYQYFIFIIVLIPGGPRGPGYLGPIGGNPGPPGPTFKKD